MTLNIINTTMSLINNLVFSLLCLSMSSCEEIVVTNSGPVRGRFIEEYGVSYLSYQGIPYAENPTGDLRFSPPVPKAPWSETLNATKEGPVCPQPVGRYSRDQMNEDCLFLNIYVPANNPKGHLMPVLVFIHGGELQSLSGDTQFIYGPQLLLQRGIVVVTLNYRLGVLGFLSLDIDQATGNAGLKDALLALKWINENIRNFGGDPNKITIGGNSAGGVIVHYLLLSERSTGLFERAIVISGSALSYRFLARHPKDIAFKLADELGFKTKDQYALLNNFKRIDSFQLVDTTEKMGRNNTRNGLRPFAPFVPRVEIETSHAVITEEPIKIIKDGIPQNVPVLVGFNYKEGIKMLNPVWSNPQLLDYLNEDFELCIPSNIEYPYGSHESVYLANSIRQFYFCNGNITNDSIEGFVNLGRDAPFSYPVDAWIELHKERNTSNKVFYYMFNYDGGLNWFKLLNDIDYPGTGHGDELGYIFVTNETKSKLEHLDARDETMVDVMLTYLTNFVNFGNPSPDSSDACCTKTKWLETTRNMNYLLLNDNPQNMPSRPTETNLEFWSNVYEEYYAYLKNCGPKMAKVIP